ncbi:MAG: Gfo/Idh/MocA family oxidoreductase [Alphaproteobacteria bacterium]|nr:Gfo/Idh/MocA family oxidoreductase [Alphaproteobacteria bacterium]
MAKLRIGVIGTANVARQFIADVAPSPTVEIVAVASRDAAKAERFARAAGVARFHASYDALLADRAIDAIYNPLPNSMHAEWTIKAAAAGKHILCEKPLSVTADEARAMFAAARKHGVHLVEAYPYLAHPQTQTMRALLDEGAIGAVKLIRASIGFTVFDPATNIRLNAELAGGALRDCGSYPVSFAIVVAKEKPARVHAAARWAPSGVDHSLVATLEFRSGILAQIACSVAVGSHRHALVAGDGGVLETTFLNHPPLGGPSEIHLKRGNRSDTPRETIAAAGGSGFRLEAEAFQRLVAGDAAAWTGVTAAQSVDIMETLEAILKSAHGGAPVDLPA